MLGPPHKLASELFGDTALINLALAQPAEMGQRVDDAFHHLVGELDLIDPQPLAPSRP